jgi:CheY-like chemotaxis protein
MKPVLFSFGILLVDDDPEIIEQHKILLNNRAFRRETPGRIYSIFKQHKIIDTDNDIEEILRNSRWPTKSDLSGLLRINPDIEDTFTILEPHVAYSADEAENIWNEQMDRFNEGLAVYVVLLDHDMPIRTGYDLAKVWRPLAKESNRILEDSPMIIFYTGKAPLLEEAVAADGQFYALDGLSKVGLVDGILQKGASNEEFNNLIWSLIEKKIHIIVTEN